MNEISTYRIKSNQNTDLIDVQWTDEDDSLFRSFCDSDEDLDKDVASFTFKFASRDRNRVQNRVSINQKALNETSTAAAAVREILREIEHENDLYKNIEINRSNTFDLSSNN